MGVELDLNGLKTFVIALGSIPRSAALMDQLSDQGIDARIVKAVDGRFWSDLFDPTLVNINCFRRIVGRLPSGPEIGCALSHIECARQAQAAGANYALVFEEDAVVVSDLAPALEAMRNLDSIAPIVLQLYSVEEPALKKNTVTEIKTDPTHILGQYFIPPGNTVAYLMNHAAIQIFALEKIVKGVADWPPYANKVEFWAYLPWPVSHTTEGSSIEISRANLKSSTNNRSKTMSYLMSYLGLYRLSKIREHSRSLDGFRGYVRWVVVPHTLLKMRWLVKEQRGTETNSYSVS